MSWSAQLEINELLKRRDNNVLDVNFFDEIRIGLATADEIRAVVAR